MFLAKPKSAILTKFSSATKMFLAAKSLCKTLKRQKKHVNIQLYAHQI